MEIIKRKINLEQAKNRYENHLPYYRNGVKYNDDEVWGGYCLDIGILETSKEDDACLTDISWATQLSDTLPNEYGQNVKHVESGDTVESGYIYYRYKNLMMNYHWLLNVFVPSCEFYRKCTRGNIKIDVETKPFIYPYLVLLNNVGEISSGDTIGTEYCVTSLSDELIKRFKTLEKAYEFILFMIKLLTEKDKHIVTKTPYIDIEFQITSDINDIGIYSPFYKNEWIPNKKYYLGEIVYYNDIPYKLKNCDKTKYDLIEIDGRFFNDIMNGISDGNYYKVTNLSNLPQQIFRLNPNTHEPYIYFYFKNDNGITKIYHIKPYYNGYYDGVTMMTFFSDLDDDRNMRISIRWDDVTVKDTSDGNMIYGITSSKLMGLKRKVQTYDDNGNLMPFIVDSAVSVDTELQFIIGNNNITDVDGVTVSDILCEINFYENVTGITPLISYTQKNKILKVSDAPDSAATIEFVYIMGAVIDSNGNRIDNTGVQYIERYTYKIASYSAFIDSNIKRDFKYYNIDFTTTTVSYTDNTDISKIQSYPIYSNFILMSGQTINHGIVKIPIYKENDLLGIQDIYTDIDADIERGKSAAYERHNILGEVKTFQDLLHYRNDFFKLN